MANAEVMIYEGMARIKKEPTTFYNQAQIINRDISVLAIKTFSDLINDPADKRYKRFKAREKFYQKENDKNDLELMNKLIILDGLSASGIRAIRYSLEIGNLAEITANDLSEEAVICIKRNIALNPSIPLGKIITANTNINDLLYESKEKFNVIDVDPYGSASPFIYNSIESIQDGGLLCVTCTDMRNFNGANPANCWNRYGSMVLNKKYCFETALRVLLGHLERTANGFKRYIVPLLSLQINFYLRVFVRVFQSPIEAKKSCCKNGMVFVCEKCDSFVIERMGKKSKSNKGYANTKISNSIDSCEICSSKLAMIGPLWCEEIHDKSFIEKMVGNIEESSLQDKEKTLSMLSLASSEVEGSFLYYNFDALCKKVKVSYPGHKVFCSAIINANYKVSRTHLGGKYLKTNAPCKVIWAIIKELLQSKKDKETISDFAKILISKDFKMKIDFTFREEVTLMKNGENKFITKEKNWGPMKKAKIEKI